MVHAQRKNLTTKSGLREGKDRSSFAVEAKNRCDAGGLRVTCRDFKMQRPPSISVVTPCWNSARTIRETIDSVVNQHYVPIEHIVVDGGSKDETISVLESYPHLKWTSEMDEGHFHAMNKGIARATGDWIIILNADDCFRPGALAAVAREIQAHPDWDATFGDVVYVDAGGGEIYRREEAVYDYNVLRYGINYVNHQTLFVRRTVYDRIGVYRYREYPKASCYEFTLRLGKEKCRVGHVRACLVNFRIHDNISSTPSGLREIDNEGRLIRREYGVPERWQKVLSYYGRFLRQLQKLFYLGKCDTFSGNWMLEKHKRK